MNDIKYSDNKTLKLTNILQTKLNTSNRNLNYELEVQKMQSNIKVKGANQIGPVIQYIHPYVNSDGRMDVDIYIMLQCNQYIHNVEAPYTMESVLRIPDCMYCRYTGRG